MSAGAGAALSLLLFAVFTIAVAANLAKGRTPDCRCFGEMSATPIGASTLVRNLVLASGATLLLMIGPGATLGAAVEQWARASTNERLVWLGALALLAMIVGLSLVVRRFHAQVRQLTERVAKLDRQLALASTAAASPRISGVGLPVGTPAPRFELPVLAGGQASLETLTAAGVPVLLIFSSSHCPACAGLWPDIGRWQRDYAIALRIAVVGAGSAQAIEMKLIGTDVQDVLLADDFMLLDAYGLPGMPSAVVVRADGTIDSETVMGPAAIRGLVAQRVGL
jgi:hypothetical protein